MKHSAHKVMGLDLSEDSDQTSLFYLSVNSTSLLHSST